MNTNKTNKQILRRSRSLFVKNLSNSRLKNGSCKDDAPPEFYYPRCRAKDGSMVVPTVKDTHVATSALRPQSAA